MRWLRVLRARLRAWLRRDVVTDEIREELEFHVEMRVAEHVREGYDPAEARRLASRQVGSLPLWQDRGYDVRGRGVAESIWRDVQIAGRRLRRQPAFVLVAGASLGLGIGATIAIFTLVDAVLLRPLPVRAPEELVLLSARVGGEPVLSWSVSHYESLRHVSSFRGLCAFRPRIAFGIPGSAGAEVASGQLLSANCLELLGLAPQLGRLLSEHDDRDGLPVAVISDAFWRRHFGADAGVIGRTIPLKGRAVTIVGVTPPGFHGLEPGRAVDISLPLALRSWVLQGALASSTEVRYLRLTGRLAPGASVDGVTSELNAGWRHALGRAGAPAPPDAAFQLLPGGQGLNELREPFGGPLRLLMAAVALLLLLACTNLASLMTARARARAHEMAVRLALGGGRGRLLRLLMTESLILALLGGALGVAFAQWASRMIIVLLSQGRTDVVLETGLDVGLIAFATAITLLASLIFGLWPALEAVHSGRRTTLNAGPRTLAGSHRGTRLLIATQTAISVVLMVAAVLFARSLANLYDLERGLARDDVFVVRIQPGMAGEPQPRIPQILWDFTERIGRVPGVRSVTQVQDLPLGGWSARMSVSLPGQAPNPDEVVHVNYVGPRFFDTLGIPLISGRDLPPEHHGAAPFAIVSAALGARYFPGQSPVGQRLQVGSDLMEIAGVARDVPYASARAAGELVLYTPFARNQTGIVVMRADLPAAAVASLSRQTLREIAPAVPVVSITTMADHFERGVAGERLLASFGGFFAMMATLLVAIGVYGTLSASLAERRRELGVRLALGATPGALSVGVLARAMRPVAAGLLLGLAFAGAVAGLAEAVLFGVGTYDLPTYVVSAAAVLGAAALAGGWPAWLVARVDPVLALRQE